MIRSIVAGPLALSLAAFAAVACTRNSDAPGVVTAPVASGASAPRSDPAVPTPAASSSATPAPSAEAATGPADGDGGVPAQLRACQTDADCVAVPRVGCCHNGWMEAVNVGQQDAYAHSFTCPTRRPMCPMYIVKETRVPRCDTSAHLCAMVTPSP